MPAMRTNSGVHRDYPGSQEDLNNQDAALDQILTAAELRQMTEATDAQADDIDEVGDRDTDYFALPQEAKGNAYEGPQGTNFMALLLAARDALTP